MPVTNWSLPHTHFIPTTPSPTFHIYTFGVNILIFNFADIPALSKRVVEKVWTFLFTFHILERLKLKKLQAELLLLPNDPQILCQFSTFDPAGDFAWIQHSSDICAAINLTKADKII